MKVNSKKIEEFVKEVKDGKYLDDLLHTLRTDLKENLFYCFDFYSNGYLTLDGAKEDLVYSTEGDIVDILKCVDKMYETAFELLERGWFFSIWRGWDEDSAHDVVKVLSDELSKIELRN